jgi:hypothetical protein
MGLLGRTKDKSEETERELKRRIKENRRVVAKLRPRIRSGRAATAEIEQATAAAAAAVAASRELQRRDRDRAMVARQLIRAGSPVLRLARRLFADEIVGVTLDSSRLTDDEMEEARRLLRLDRLDGKDARSAERLVDVAAGEPGFIKRRRREAEQAAAREREAERLHRAMLPRRRDPEPGSIELPRFLFQWVTNGKDNTFDVTDLGVLAAVMFSFAGETAALFARARFDRADGTPTITVHDAGQRVGLVFGADATGTMNVRVSLHVLARNKWIDMTGKGGTLRIQPGERMRKILADGRS